MGTAMKLRQAAIGAAVAAPWVLAATTWQQAAATPPDYMRDIEPILRASCWSCHGADVQLGDLRLDTPEGIAQSVVPGDPVKSELVRRIKGLDGKPRMPMGFAPLKPAEIAAIEAWIRAGAKTEGAKPAKHWAYQAPTRPAPPNVGAGWAKNAIDRFVARALDDRGLNPNPEADRAALCRRVYLDLVGLPPTLRELETFLADKRPDAYERLVDRMLESPHYGEKMAQHWLDLARYADTDGYEADFRRTIWPYRDWVIRAFNQDMPFDRFTIEQIAGDLLPNPSRDQLVATGFHRNTMTNREGGVDQGEQRWLTLVDRVGTTGTVWLASTLACAQCHDHKYDPVSIDEFYKMLAFFETSDEPDLSMDPEASARKAELDRRIAELEASLAKLKRDDEVYKAAEAALKAVRDQAAALAPPTTMILRERPGQYPPATPIRLKGTYLLPDKMVVAGTPKFLQPMSPGDPANRLGLARWLVSDDNPLTARVFVNRMWQQIFGRAIVETPEDFGLRAAKPSHPELLDWLATEFMAGDWRIKRLMRLIVTSATYRQASSASAAKRAADPENVWLSWFPRQRLAAESVRDAGLVASGLLSRKVGGPSVMPYQPEGIWDLPYNGDQWRISEGEDRYRRGLYTFWRRTAPYPMFMAFDAVSREACTVNRVNTNTPLQALALLNDEAAMVNARALAKAMLAEGGTTVESRLRHGFRRCTSRQPTAAELSEVAGLFARRLKAYEADAEAAKKAADSAEPFPHSTSLAESAAYVLAANVLLNLDETITKD